MNSPFLPASATVDESSTALSQHRSKLALVQHFTPYSLLAQSSRPYSYVDFHQFYPIKLLWVSPFRGHAQACPKIRRYRAMINMA